jgi:protein TonB
MRILFLFIYLFTSNYVISQESAILIEFPDEDPSFENGAEGLQKYISENIKYPLFCILTNVQGKVYVSFIVERDGKVSSVKIEKGAHPKLNKEAKRVVKNMPNWNPGKVGQEPVRTKMRLPIVFDLT